MISDARTEIRGDWMAGAYQVGASVSVSTAAKLSIDDVLNNPNLLQGNHSVRFKKR